MLSDESESEITIPDVTVPKSIISVVDAYGRLDNGCIVVFNFTVNLDHGIASKKLNEFLSDKSEPVHELEPLRVLCVWIVPPDIARNFKFQKKNPVKSPNFNFEMVDQAMYTMDVEC